MKPRTLAAASLLLLPAALAREASAQTAAGPQVGPPRGIKGESRTIFIKYADGYEIAGVDGKQAVYRAKDGRLFTVDPKTGDLKFLSLNFAKIEMKYARAKGRFVGTDAKGNAIHEDPQGRRFTLDVRTGDITIIK